MKVASNIKCSKAQKLMSPYIDSMAEPEESELLEFHLETCEPCQRQLQSYISLRNMVARIEPARPHEDLVLDTRVRLSHARSGLNGWWMDRIEALLVNVLKPVAIPAVSGITLTVLSFSVLFGHLALNMSAESLDTPFMALEQPARATDQTMLTAPGNAGKDWVDPVSVQGNVDERGKMYEIRIIGGAQTPAMTRWLKDTLYLAQFAPGTRLGKPVNSKINLVIVNVRS